MMRRMIVPAVLGALLLPLAAVAQQTLYPTLPALTGKEYLPLSYVAPPAALPVFTTPDQISTYVLGSGGGMSKSGSSATAAALGNIATVATGCNDVSKVVSGIGTCVTPAAGYTAPTIGSTVINSGASVPSLAGLTSLGTTTLNANGVTNAGAFSATIGGGLLATNFSAGFPHFFIKNTDAGGFIFQTSGGSAILTINEDTSVVAQSNLLANTLSVGGIPTSAGAGGLYVCIDNTGVTYKKSSCP